MIRMKNLLLVAALLCGTVQAQSKKYVDSLQDSFIYGLQVVGDASRWYFNEANELLKNFHIDDNWEVVIANSNTGGIAVAAWCPFTKCKCLAVNEQFLENVPVGVKRVILAHEVAHMTDFQAFGLKQFFGQMQMGGMLASRAIEEFADKKASLMVACSDCLYEVADFWEQIAQVTGKTHTEDLDEEDHPAPLRRAHYSKQLAKEFEMLEMFKKTQKCDHHDRHPRKENQSSDKYFSGMNLDNLQKLTNFTSSSCVTRSYQVGLQFGW